MGLLSYMNFHLERLRVMLPPNENMWQMPVTQAQEQGRAHEGVMVERRRATQKAPHRRTLGLKLCEPLISRMVKELYT